MAGNFMRMILIAALTSVCTIVAHAENEDLKTVWNAGEPTCANWTSAHRPDGSASSGKGYVTGWLFGALSTINGVWVFDGKPDFLKDQDAEEVVRTTTAFCSEHPTQGLLTLANAAANAMLQEAIRKSAGEQPKPTP